MKRLSLVVVLLFVAGTAVAATHVTHKRTMITKAKARAAALAAAPGKIVEGELEREHGKMEYSFDIEQSGQPGVEEVKVDAHTGKVVSKTHESAKKEAAEKAKEAKTDSSKMPH